MSRYGVRGLFDINERMIRKYAGAVIFDRAQRIYSANCISFFKIEMEKDSSVELVKAVVYSAEDRKNINVNIIFEEKEKIIEFQCECSDFKAMKKHKACKHIAAVLLRYLKGEPKVIQEKFNVDSIINNSNNLKKSISSNEISIRTIVEPVINENIKEKTDERLNEKANKNVNENINEEANKEVNLKINERKPLINAAQKSMSNTKKYLKLKLVINFSFYKDEKNISIEMQLGEDSVSTIMEVKAFLLALKNKNKYQLNSSFSYEWGISSFKKEDIEILKLIAASNKFGAKKFNGKSIYLEEYEVKKLFEILSSKLFDLIINNKLYKDITILSEDIPLQFEIRQEKNQVHLVQLSEMPVALTESKEYYFFRDKLYKPGSVQAYKYGHFYKEFLSTKSCEKIYESNDVERTLDLLKFKLKDISNNLKVMKLPKEKLKEYPLKARIYINSSKTGIFITVVFNYGGINIDLLNDSKYELSSKIGKRDYISEKEIIELIRRYHFISGRSGFLLDNENMDYVVDFIKNGISELKKIAEVNCNEELKNVKIYEADDYTPEINFKNNYLEFSLNINNISYMDTVNIFEALKDYETCCRLENGNYISLKNKELVRISTIIGERRIENISSTEGVYRVSRNVSVLSGRVCDSKTVSEEEKLRKQRENEKIYIEKNKKLKDIMTKIENAGSKPSSLPSELEPIMREYQKVGFSWFKTLASQGIGGILADEMGLGKTLQAIALILDYVKVNKEVRIPSIVVAPTSLIYNWENEIRKFAPSLNTIVIYGNQKDRRNLREELTFADVVITSYSLVGRDIDEYAGMEFSYIFIDEAQQIKNSKTMASKAVKLIKARGRFALTGTPIENSLSELWSVFDFIMPGYLLSYRQFKELYEIPIMNYNDPKALASLNSIIKPFILRRLKSEVLYELPDKIEQKLIVEMTYEQKSAYIQCLNYSKNSIETEISEKGYNRSHIHILSALTRLRQVCCEPSVVMDDYIGESAKMLALDTIVDESIASGHRILIFSQFIKVLQLIKARLQGNNINCFYLDGSTKVQERLHLVEKFNAGKADVFLISLKAGGYGLNLTGADIVIHFDPWWNPAVEDQATDRAHRIGQTRKVEVIKLVTKGTIEEKILKLHDRKRRIAKSIIDDKNSEENFLTNMSRQEIEDLFIM